MSRCPEESVFTKRASHSWPDHALVSATTSRSKTARHATFGVRLPDPNNLSIPQK